MHILHLMADNSSVPYFNWFAEESQKYSDLKFSFVSLNPTLPQMLEDMNQRGCDCYWIPYDTSHRKVSMLKAVPALYHLFKKIKPDVVHTHLFDDSLPGLIAAKTAGIKVRIITKQDTGFHWYFKPQYVFFDKLNNFIATHIHTVATENNRFVIEKEKAPVHKIRLIRNGFPYKLLTSSDEPTISKLKNQYGLHNKFVIGTVARLIEWKGHQLILDAAEQLVKKHPHVKFIWAGTGDKQYTYFLLKLIEEKGLNEYVVLTDWLDRKIMPSFYKCMNIYLHPAINEPFGFAIAEAMMNQVPIAATRTGSTDLVTHKQEGYILTENNVDDIIEAVDFYHNSPQQRETISKAGHLHSQEHLSFIKMWNGHVSLYKNAVSENTK